MSDRPLKSGGDESSTLNYWKLHSCFSYALISMAMDQGGAISSCWAVQPTIIVPDAEKLRRSIERIAAAGSPL
jgi:hypothetical protein